MSDTKPKSPRLQLRYEPDPSREESWLCFYEIVVPLSKHDIRRERYDDDHNRLPDVEEAIFSAQGSTRLGYHRPPCYSEKGELFYDPPYRDGAHATWDSEKLGLPIYCVTHDGKYVEKPADWGKK